MFDQRINGVTNAVSGLESRHGGQHLIAERLHDWTALLGELDMRSRDLY